MCARPSKYQYIAYSNCRGDTFSHSDLASPIKIQYPPSRFKNLHAPEESFLDNYRSAVDESMPSVCCTGPVPNIKSLLHRQLVILLFFIDLTSILHFDASSAKLRLCSGSLSALACQVKGLGISSHWTQLASIEIKNNCNALLFFLFSLEPCIRVLEFMQAAMPACEISVVNWSAKETTSAAGAAAISCWKPVPVL